MIKKTLAKMMFLRSIENFQEILEQILEKFRNFDENFQKEI